jgi:hypothetical protein
MSRRSWLAAVATVAGLGLAAPATTASADPGAPAAGAVSAGDRSVAAKARQLPRGWTLTSTPAGARLAWRSARPLPFGDARIDVLVGTTRLGTAVVAPDRRSLHLGLPAAALPADLTGLQVLAAGRRLDQPAAGARTNQADSLTLPAALPAAAVDPGRPGPYRTRTGEYDLPGIRVAGLAARVEVRGVVVSPVGATGRRPLVLLLHGRHATCSKGQDISIDWPCPSGWTPIPSHRGYLQTQELLASQGYATVSISANGVNGQDAFVPDGGAAARSALVRHHLALWSSWAGGPGRAGAPEIIRATPPADLGRMLLVGHSRGGEGVNRAALDSAVSARTGRPAPWRVSGLLHLAPTAFGQNPVPGTPAVVVLPTCDGDVYDLQGQQYVDRMRDLATDGALRSSVLVVGANHNYFNREWTPGEAQAPADDDWGDTSDAVCGTRRGNLRLTAAAQRTVGATYVAAAARAFIARDAAVLPLLDGTGVRPASVGRARVQVAALGGRRRPVAVAGSERLPAPTVGREGTVSASLCAGFSSSPRVRTCPSFLGAQGVHPHFLPLGLPAEPAPRGIAVSWARTGGAARVTVPRTSVAGDTALALRVAVPAGSAGTRFAVSVSDAKGKAVSLGRVTVTGLPRTDGVATHWAQEVRLPLKGVRGVDLARVTAVRLVPVSRTGKLVLLDVWGWRAGAATGPALVLPRIDVPTVSVREGDAGTRRVTVALRAVGGSTRAARSMWVGIGDFSSSGWSSTGRLVTLAPRQLSADLTFTVTGDTVHDADRVVSLGVKPVRGLVAGDWSGGLTVRNDDPQPSVSVTPVTTAVTEAGTLRWSFRQAAVSRVDTLVELEAAQPASGPEVSTDDVPRSWLEQWTDPPATPTALSAVPLRIFVLIPAGQTRAFLDVPTSADSRAEGTEQLAFAVTAPLPGLPVGTRITASVSDPG